MIGRATATVVLLLGAWSVGAGSQPVLTPDSERSFLRLMQMAQTGAFGPDVVNANVGIDGNAVNVELVRATPPNQRFVLTFKTRARGDSRYFDIEGREGTTPADVARLGRAIDEAFDASPFQYPSDDDRAGGTQGPAQPSMASKRYTVVVTVVIAAALGLGLLLLWGSAPPHPPGGSAPDRRP